MRGALTTELLDAILAEHKRWLEEEVGAKRANLSGYDLRGINLSGRDLRGINLSGSNLSESDLSESDMSGCNLSCSNLYGSNLSESDLNMSDLSHSDLSNSDLSHSDLGHSDLSHSYMSGCNLSCSNLRDSDMHDARGIFCVGPCDGWTLYAVRHPDGPRIKAGCRWFTVAEARAHWCDEHRSGWEHAEKMLAGVNALLALGRVHGWEGCA